MRRFIVRGSGCLLVVLLSLAALRPARAQTAPPDNDFQKVVLDANVNQPTELAVAADGRVFFLDRTGRLRVYRPASQTTVTAGTLGVDITGNHGRSAAGSYTLELRYANGGSTNRVLETKVGSTVVASALAFTPTGAWTTGGTKTVVATLVAGANKICATATGVDGPNIDALVRR
jgi:hypothetical protein